MKLHKKIFSINAFIAVLIALFFAIATGGCGGGGNGSISSGGSGDGYNPTVVVDEAYSAVAPSTKVEQSELHLLSDDDGKPYFLDFFGIPQVHVNNSTSTSSVRISAAESIAAAAEKKLTVPSMTWIDRLRTESEGGNIYSVPLVAGTEYTFEFSRNLTDSLGGILPHLSFYDPDNSLLSLDAAQEIEVETAAYPAANPSIICYTFTPSVSGNYFARLVDGEPYSGLYLDDSGNLQTFTPESDKGVVLFIYKERRNEDNETGYYTNFYLTDDSGNKTDSISVNDLIEMRKLFIEDNMAYFKEVYGQGLEDDDYGNGNSFEIAMNDTAKERFESYVAQVLGKIGLVYKYYELDDYITPADVAALSADLAGLSKASKDQKIDAYLEKIIREKNIPVDEKTGTIKKVRGRTVVNSASNAVSTSAVADEPAKIDAVLTGIPFEERYFLGRGSMAHTYLDPPGGVTISLKEAYDDQTKAELEAGLGGYRQQFLELTSGDKDHKSLLASDDRPSASDTIYTHPITTNFYTDFVKTSTQAETLSQTDAKVSLAMSALGLSLGTGSTSNFKFGLTSSTFVIHYEEREIGYREVKNKELLKTWEDASLFDMMDLCLMYAKEDGDFVKLFRHNLGDYYVSGLQYGACFDAYISITTRTQEQLEKVETDFRANLNFGSFKASADISNKAQDILKENQAKISVRVVTNGMGHNVPTPVEIPNSTDITAMDNVFGELLTFRNKLGAGNRAQYAPVRVQMSRWRSHPKIAIQMMLRGDMTGNIPITNAQATKIASFNTRLRDLRAYQNVVVDIPGIDSKTATIRRQFDTVIQLVRGEGDDFYNSDNQTSFDKTVKDVEVLTDKFNALADRYVFYTKLMIAQKKEKDTYDELKAAADKAGEGYTAAFAAVRKMPFGAEGGGSSGYVKFDTSNYVKADIKAGQRFFRDVHISRSKASAERIEWKEQEYQDELMRSYGYIRHPARFTATATNDDGKSTDDAVFCFVRVASTNPDGAQYDRARWLTRGSPAVGTKDVRFFFRSSYSYSVDWEIEGQSMRMDPEDYPFNGLTTEH